MHDPMDATRLVPLAGDSRRPQRWSRSALRSAPLFFAEVVSHREGAGANPIIHWTSQSKTSPRNHSAVSKFVESDSGADLKILPK
jgi:hypothetical protein